MKILSFSRITSRVVVLNGDHLVPYELLLEKMPFERALEAIQAQWNIAPDQGPAFTQMDAFCKLGYVAAELVMRGAEFDSEVPKHNMMVHIHSRSACADRDVDYQALIDAGEDAYDDKVFSLFTAPTAICSVLSQRHHIYEESSLMVSEGFNPRQMYQLIYDCFCSSPIPQYALLGFVEQLRPYSSAFMCLLQREPDDTAPDYEAKMEAFTAQLYEIY